MLVLLSLFDPISRSSRAIQQVSDLPTRSAGSAARASLGSLSEAVEVFDLDRLLGIIDESPRSSQRPPTPGT